MASAATFSLSVRLGQTPGSTSRPRPARPGPNWAPTPRPSRSACSKRSKASWLGCCHQRFELDGRQLPPGLGRQRVGGRGRLQVLDRPGRLPLGQTQLGLAAQHRTVRRAITGHRQGNGRQQSHPGASRTQRPRRLRLGVPVPAAAKASPPRSATQCRRRPANRPAAPPRPRPAATSAAGRLESSPA